MQNFVLSLTLFRILASPLILISSTFLGNYWFTFWLFMLAASTDYLDGRLARSYKVESRIGAILDPIGDKLLLLFALLSIFNITQNNYILLVGSLILAREFWISAIREYSSFRNLSNLTQVTFVAKTKTAFQFLAIGMFFFGAASNLALIIFLANFTLIIALLLSIKSAIDYSSNIFNK